MKISLTPISVSRMFLEGDMDLKKFVGYCAELKVDGIDILDSACYPWFWKDRQRDFRLLPELLKNSNLELAAYATGNNFAKVNEEERRRNVEIVQKALEEASVLGAPLVRIFGGNHKESGGEEEIETANGLEMIIESIEKCLPVAEKHGVILALENHGRLPGHSYELKALVEYFNSSFLKVTFDCANFMANNMDEPENPLDAYQSLKGHVAHVHVKDVGPCISSKSRKIEGYVAGKGFVPLRQFIACLEDYGYDGFCSLEYEASGITPEIYGVPQSLDYLKKIRSIHKVINNLKKK